MNNTFKNIAKASAASTAEFLKEMYVTEKDQLAVDFNGVKFEVTVTILDEEENPVMLTRATALNRPAIEESAAEEKKENENSDLHNDSSTDKEIPNAFYVQGQQYYPVQYVMPVPVNQAQQPVQQYIPVVSEQSSAPVQEIHNETVKADVEQKPVQKEETKIEENSAPQAASGDENEVQSEKVNDVKSSTVAKLYERKENDAAADEKTELPLASGGSVSVDKKQKIADLLKKYSGMN